MKIHLDRVEQAFGAGTPAAFIQKTMVKPPVSAPLANPSSGKKRVDGADHLVIMESHDDRKTVILDRPEDRGGNLMMDVVKMDEVRTFFFQEILELPPRFQGIQDSERGSYFVSNRRGAVKIDRRDKIPGKGRTEVLGMLHRKEDDPVTPAPKELSRVEQRGLGPTPPIKELVHQKDLHRRRRSTKIFPALSPLSFRSSASGRKGCS